MDRKAGSALHNEVQFVWETCISPKRGPNSSTVDGWLFQACYTSGESHFDMK